MYLTEDARKKSEGKRWVWRDMTDSNGLRSSAEQGSGQDDRLSTSALRPGYFPCVRGPSVFSKPSILSALWDSVRGFP